MLSVAKRFFTDADDAQDALQDAFLSAFKALPAFDGRSQLGTWLHRIVVNACLMRLRTQRRHPEQSIDELLPQFLADGHRASPSPRWKNSLSEMEKAETREAIRNQIAKLPEGYRTVLLLRDIEDYDTQTVARMLELTESAVKVRLHRARQALRTLLDPLFREDFSC
jgi:RNA polymerase sigma-70 factor (ECF subfamily)